MMIVLGIPSVGIIVWFFVSTLKAFRKFDRLEKYVQEKLLLMEYYMVFVRRLSTEELMKVGELPEEEIKAFNEIHDWDERVKTARKKINK
jgi:hypothetical protein